jgi:serine/threonine protein phosphatase 1
MEFDDTSWRRVDTVEVPGPVAVVGDIHGRLDLLQALVARLDAQHPQGAMPLFVVGDVVDRGPDTRGVLDLLVARGARGVRGNHEEWFARFATGGGFDPLALSPVVGGRAALSSYGFTEFAARALEADWRRVPAAHGRFVASLPVAMRLVVDGAPFWLVHAGVSNVAVTVEEPVARMHELASSEPDDLLWPSRSPEELAALDGPQIVGHVCRRDPVDAGHVLAIDTGSGVFEDGALTAVVLPARRFVTVRG